MANYEYTTPNQVNMNFGETFFMTRKAPAIAQRVFDKLQTAQNYIANEKGTAVPGLVITVFEDIEQNNGVYFAKQITQERLNELSDTQGPEYNPAYKSTSNKIELVKIKADAGGQFKLALKSTNKSIVIDNSNQDIQTYGNIIPMGDGTDKGGTFTTTIAVGGVEKGKTIGHGMNIYQLLKDILCKVYTPNHTDPKVAKTKLQITSKSGKTYDITGNTMDVEVGTIVTSGTYAYKYTDGTFGGNDGIDPIQAQCNYIAAEDPNNYLLVNAPDYKGDKLLIDGSYPISGGKVDFIDNKIDTNKCLEDGSNSKDITFKFVTDGSVGNTNRKCVREGETTFTVSSAYQESAAQAKNSDDTDNNLKIPAGKVTNKVSITGKYLYYFGFTKIGEEAIENDEAMLNLSTHGAVDGLTGKPIINRDYINIDEPTPVVTNFVTSPKDFPSYVLCVPTEKHGVKPTTFNKFNDDITRAWEVVNKIDHKVDDTIIEYLVYALPLQGATEYHKISVGVGDYPNGPQQQ